MDKPDLSAIKHFTIPPHKIVSVITWNQVLFERDLLSESIPNAPTTLNLTIIRSSIFLCS